MDSSTTETKASSGGANGSALPIEVGKEVKEKKDRSSWVKTIGMRTLRLRRSTDSRSSRLSIPSFSSLERPGKNKKNKSNKPADIDTGEGSEFKPDGITNYSKSEHVKVQNNITSAASAVNLPASTSTSKDTIVGLTPTTDGKASGENLDKQDPARFLGEGLTFKGKLIGVLEVSGPRGDRICQEALSELKMAVKAAGEHKQKITIHIALDGLRIRDEKTGDCLYHHQVHKISFIAQDLTDTRAFGYIFGSPDTGHRFFGIKTEKSASQVVIAMRDLFQVVFDLKKKEIERAKQQLEMQQKFLATRAAETAPPSKTEPKFSIAETYIEGACALGASSVPNRSAPEVDLLNLNDLEVELTSLQEGLNSIHHNLADSGPFRGSTASISSDPMNPMPKRSSISSSTNTNNTTPVPAAFNASGDPFGDSFDPYFGSSTRTASFNMGSNSSKLGGHQAAVSCDNSALTSPFSSDPFAQVDPFPGPKFPGDSEFFNADPFDSPSGPFSFTFPNDSQSANVRKTSEGRIHSNTSLSVSPAPIAQQNCSAVPPAIDTSINSLRTGGGWTASFEDNFVPDSGVTHGPASESFVDLKPGQDKFTELDPLGSGRNRPFIDRKDFFHELKNPPKKVLNEHNSSDAVSSSPIVLSTSVKPHPSSIGSGDRIQKVLDGTSIPNSFSTNFDPPNNGTDFNTHFKPRNHYSYDARAESPPNYSPPPPPRVSSSVANSEFQSSNARELRLIPPPASSPSNSRLLSKKSSEILKQMTISESSSSPRTLPRTSGRLGKQFTIDISLKDEVPNLSPPPRPPHNTISTTPAKAGSLASAVPRPSSGTGSDRLRKISETGSLSGLPPEPPPRPLQTTTISNQSMHLVSPPPPLPPKKQSLSSTFSSPLAMKQSLSNDTKSLADFYSNRSSLSDANDLPLPLPLRKTHGISDHPSLNNVQGGRYAVPLASSLSGSPSLSKRDNESIRSTSSIDSVTSNPNIIKLTMEQALAQVASLSLGDLARRLELPVENLTHLTIQQLAEKLTDMDLERKKQIRRDTVKSSRQPNDRADSKLGFDDDFSSASGPANVTVQKDSGYDRYAVFRELAVEDASGFSIADNCSNMLASNSDDDDVSTSRTLDKTLNSRDSSSERTLQADITGGSNHITASFTTGIANTMDDVTDVNLSDDQDNGKFPLDDEDDLSSGFMNKPEWATFESNFDDPFATTALVKAEDGNESPWDSDEGEKEVSQAKVEVVEDIRKDQYDFKPFVKPEEPPQAKEDFKDVGRKRDDRIIIEKEKEKKDRNDTSPDLVKSPPGRFQRQSSGSSRHSERSSGGGTAPGRGSDFSDSGRPTNNGSRRPRKGSKDYDRHEIDRDREGSGHYRDRDLRDRDRDHIRSDSRNSYSSMSRKHRNGDSDDDYVPSNNSIRGTKVRLGSGRRDRDYDRGEAELEPLEDEEDDRSYVSHHSNYSTGHPRRHKRYPPKHFHHSGRRRSDKAASPDRCSNRESDEDSFEDENGAYPRKREKDYYSREREYYERHHRPMRPSSSGGANGKRHSRDSPRTADLYYRRDRRGRHRDDDEFNDSREFSDYSGEDEYRGGHGYRHGHASHRRIRSKRSHYRDKDPRDSRGGHYYTNSPSFDSDSGPEAEKELNSKSENKQRRPTSAKHEEGRRYSRGSPELSKHYEGTSGRRASASGSARRYQSELSLNSKTVDSQKLSSFTFEDDFGASSLPVETSNSRQASDQLSSPSGDPGKYKCPDPEKVSTSSADVNEFVSCNSELPVETKTSQSHSPFENDFVGPPELQNGLQGGATWENTETASSDTRIGDNCINNGQQEQILEKEEVQQDNDRSRTEVRLIDTVEEENGSGEYNSTDIFPSSNDPKAFNFSGRRLESIKSEEEKSNDDSHSHSASESAINMKKSDSYNIFKQRVDDPFADDDFFA